MAYPNSPTVAYASSGHSTHSYAHNIRLMQMPLEDNTAGVKWSETKWTRSACWEHHREEAWRKRFIVPNPDPFVDLSQLFIPNPDNIEKYTWNKCHLLSLPKELRLEIWTYVLTDPSMLELCVGITRQALSPLAKQRRSSNAKLDAHILRPRNNPINLNLLLANRFIYEEALPVLYKSAKFVCWDLEGILPLFFDKLSTFALSRVRCIKLLIPEAIQSAEFGSDRSRLAFHWAVTCAQIARLDGTLRKVEISGYWSIFDNKRIRRAILFPLCKIKTAKKYVPNHNEEFQRMLVEAEQEMKVKAKLREECAKAERAEKGRHNDLQKHRTIDEDETISKRRYDDASFWDVDSILDDWDLVSMDSESSMSRALHDGLVSETVDQTNADILPNEDWESIGWENID